MKTIWKYKIAIADKQLIDMPMGAKPLYVGKQDSDIYLWVEIDSSVKTYPRPISVYGTGHEMPENPGRYVGTFMLGGGALVFHVYDDEASTRSSLLRAD